MKRLRSDAHPCLLFQGLWPSDLFTRQRADTHTSHTDTTLSHTNREPEGTERTMGWSPGLEAGRPAEASASPWRAPLEAEEAQCLMLIPYVLPKALEPLIYFE